MNIADLVKGSSTSQGTGNFVIQDAPVAPYRAFSVLGAVGTTFGYKIAMGGVAETGIGTIVSLSPFEFSRVPRAGASLVNFAAGTKDIEHVVIGDQYKKYESGTSARVVFTSSLCVSDADLSIGSTSFGTDQRAKLQTLLDLASAGPLILVFDGAYSAGPSGDGLTSLRVRGNTIIQGLPGCGVIARNATNCALLSNYNRSKTTITDKNIRIEGGIWNGNAPGQAHDTTVNGFVYVLDFVGVDGLFLGRGVQLLNTRTFTVHFGNWRNVVCDEVYIDCGVNSVINSDGLHFNGPGQYATVNNLTVINANDDGLAFNADDGAVSANLGPYYTYGDIRDVEINNLMLNCHFAGIRLLSGGSRLDRVSINGVRGTTGAYWLVIDNFVPSDTTLTGPGNVGTVSVEDACVENVTYSTNVEATVSINCRIDRLSFSNISRSKFLNQKFPTLRFGEKTNIGQLSIDKLRGSPSLGGTFLTNQIDFIAGAHVDSCKITNSMFDAPSAVSGYPITIAAGASIGQLTLLGNTGINFTGFVQNSGTVTYLHNPAASNFMDGASVVDTTKPTVNSASVTNATPTTVTVVASENLDSSFASAPSAFVISGTGTAHTVTAVAVSGTNIILTVSPAFVSTEAAPKLAYTPTGTNNIRDVASTPNQMDAFSNLAITNSVGGGNAGPWTLGAGYVDNGSSSLTYTKQPSASVSTAVQTAADAYSGNVQVSARIRISGSGAINGGYAALMLRGQNITNYNDSTTRVYYFSMSPTNGDGGFKLSLKNQTPETVLSTQKGDVVTGGWYIMTFAAKGTALTGKVQREADGFWLQPDGTWSATPAISHSATDTTLPAGTAAAIGVFTYAQVSNANPIVIDFTNFTSSAAP